MKSVVWSLPLFSVLALLCCASASRGEPFPASLRACRACHSLTQGAPNSVGPNLFGVIGRRAGSVQGFKYSEAMKRADIIWTSKRIRLFIKDPQKMVRGTRMSYALTDDASAVQVASDLGLLK